MNVSQNLFFYGYNNFREWLNDDNNIKISLNRHFKFPRV